MKSSKHSISSDVIRATPRSLGKGLSWDIRPTASGYYSDYRDDTEARVIGHILLSHEDVSVWAHAVASLHAGYFLSELYAHAWITLAVLRAVGAPSSAWDVERQMIRQGEYTADARRALNHAVSLARRDRARERNVRGDLLAYAISQLHHSCGAPREKEHARAE